MAYQINKKVRFLIIAGVLCLIFAGLLYYSFLVSSNKGRGSDRVEIACEILNLEIISSPDDMYRGLSGRDSLCADCGLLFNFPDSSPRRFTMRDMLFPIDIIFLNQSEVVFIAENLLPDKPGQESIYPSPAADQVLEVNAGYAADNNIRFGDKLFLPR